MHGLENVNLSDFIIVIVIVIIIIIIIIENMLSLALFSKKESMIHWVITDQFLFFNTSSSIPEFVINERFPNNLKSILNTCQYSSLNYKSTAINRVTYPGFITPLCYWQWLVVAFILTSAE